MTALNEKGLKEKVLAKWGNVFTPETEPYESDGSPVNQCATCGNQSPFSECQPCSEAREAKESEAKRVEKLKDKFTEVCPPKYREVERCKQQQLIDNTESILWGGFGTGKTYLGWSLIKTLLFEKEIGTFKFITEVGLINHFRGNGDAVKVADKFSYYGLLVIDEFGKNNDSDFSKSQIFDIVNRRHEWNRRTLLICNADSINEVQGIFPTALLDRYKKSVIELSGKSRR